MGKGNYIFLLFFIFLACGKQADPAIIINVEEEFSIDLWENLSTSSNSFAFNLSTVKRTFACRNYEIEFDANRSGKSLSINLLGIIEPDNCEAGNGSAVGVADFQSFETGAYPISIDIKDKVTNKGFLEVTEEYYQLHMDTKDGITLEENRLYRIPKDLIWGAIQFKDVKIIDAFIKEIETISEPAEIKEGNYGYFRLEDKQLTVNLENKLLTPFPFVYTLTGNTTELETIVKKYKEEFANDINVIVYTGLGEVF
jgi:hypothetical protein